MRIKRLVGSRPTRLVLDDRPRLPRSDEQVVRRVLADMAVMVQNQKDAEDASKVARDLARWASTA